MMVMSLLMRPTEQPMAGNEKDEFDLESNADSLEWDNEDLVAVEREDSIISGINMLLEWHAQNMNYYNELKNIYSTHGQAEKVDQALMTNPLCAKFWM